MEIDVPFVISQAQYAGEQAMQQSIPTPMVVRDGNTLYHVPSGVCGFAWVSVYGVRSNSKLGKELLKHGFSKSTYEKCLQYWVHAGNQSMQLKEEYATAFARELTKYGITAYMNSRMD